MTGCAQIDKLSSLGSVIDRWRQPARQGGLEAAPSVRDKFLERENREPRGEAGRAATLGISVALYLHIRIKLMNPPTG